MLNRRFWHTLIALAIAGGIFITGIGWGLPSKRVDPFLYGNVRPWSGAEIQEKLKSAGEQWDDPTRGADVAGSLGPHAPRAAAVVVNATDAQRAQIVRRYHLFTYHPDEMITMMSLARMHPGQLDFDPRLYQYGGLWIYGVGAVLKAGSLLHLINLRSGPEAVAYYLDNPEQFGRFYVAARLYAAAWGLIGVWAIMRIVIVLTRNDWASLLAALLFSGMPVVVNMAHEAKPHLPATVLILLAVLGASRYVRTGMWRDACGAGALCGAALGMVLSSLPVFGILPLMSLMRCQSWRQRLAITVVAAAGGGCVYGVTNPYVVAHLFWKRDVFQSNVGNSTGMYHIGRPLAGLLTEIYLSAAGTTAPLALAGALSAGVLAVRAYRRRGDASPQECARRATGLLLATPALLIAGQFAVIGAGKPGEFGRFLMVPDIFLMIEAVVLVWTVAATIQMERSRDGARWFLSGRAVGVIMAIALVDSIGWRTFEYERAFIRDCQLDTSRMIAAGRVARLTPPDAAMALPDDPAPYLLPPVDLFRWTITRHHVDAAQDLTDAQWLDANRTIPADVLVRPVDEPNQALISWADKTIEILTAKMTAP